MAQMLVEGYRKRGSRGKHVKIRLRVLMDKAWWTKRKAVKIRNNLGRKVINLLRLYCGKKYMEGLQTATIK